jgi:hypothetical protein
LLRLAAVKKSAVVLEVIRENCLSHPSLTPPIKGGGITHSK